MTAVVRQFEAMRANPLVGQLLRFVMAGGVSTVVYSAVYLPLAVFVFGRANAVFAVPIAFVVAVTAGYFLHSSWSFRGHGAKSNGGRLQAKFVVVQCVGLGLHALITWVVTDLFGQPAWVPLIPGIILVPIVTFLLNRQWVFR